MDSSRASRWNWEIGRLATAPRMTIQTSIPFLPFPRQVQSGLEQLPACSRHHLRALGIAEPGLRSGPKRYIASASKATTTSR